jgi:uncharacterized protein YndB with AHSA1/START domain
MFAKTVPINEPADREVVITRIFDAPREVVFKAWTDPERLARWHAPKGCTLHFYKFDFRPGGAFISCLRNPASHDCLCKGDYREIVVPERIVYALSFSDEDGNFVEPADAGMDPDWPRETIVTVTFTEHECKTTLTLRQTVLEPIAKRTGAYPSWIEMLDRLARSVDDV